MKVCIHEPGSVAISRSDGMKQGLLTIGLTLGLVIPCMVIDKVYGEIVPVKALMLSSWMIAFIVASRGTYLKVYSRAARNVITVVMSAVVYLIILTALWVAAVT